MGGLVTTNGKWSTDPDSGACEGSVADRAASSVVVAGFGSPHGDDQVGWQVIELLRSEPDLAARLVVLREASELLSNLEGCRRLILVDACSSGGEEGSVTWLRWPDPRIVDDSRGALHGFTVSEVMRLAAVLGRVPTVIDVIAIETRQCTPGHEMTPTGLRAAIEVRDQIIAELGEMHDA